MTREEFVKKWADEYIGKLWRGVMADKSNPLFLRTMEVMIKEVETWLGSLHEALTEQLNAQGKKQREPEPTKAGTGGSQAKAGAARNTG